MGAWYSATSPRAVRELSGVGQGSMYHYFPTKRDLGLAALNHNCQIQLDSWKAALKDLEDPLEILTAYLTLPRDPLKGCRVGRMAQDKAVVADDGLRQPVAEAFARLREMLAAVIRMARSQGRCRQTLSRTTWLARWSPSFRAVTSWPWPSRTGPRMTRPVKVPSSCSCSGRGRWCGSWGRRVRLLLILTSRRRCPLALPFTEGEGS